MISRSVFLLISSIVVFMMASSLPVASAKQSYFVGTWHLDALYDGSDSPVALPKGKDFVMSLFPLDSSSSSSSSNDYQISIQIGNTMNTRVQITDPSTSTSSIQIGFVRSTMMMPPQELFTLEMFLTDAFPKMETMTLEEPVLTMSGPAAKIVFSRAEV